MEIVYKSDKGRKRDHNEDSIRVDRDRDIYIVADGMGGHKAGDMASTMTVEITYDYLSTNLKHKSGRKEVRRLLLEALANSHEMVKLSSDNDFRLKGMGTTLVMTIIRENIAQICHVGDSRAYLINEEIRQVTEDQSLGHFLMEKKKMPFERIPEKAWHTLLQAVGLSEKITPGFNTLELLNGDIILLCSDGLTDMLTDDEINTIVQSNKNDNFVNLAELLVDEANMKGGVDNISVVLIKYKPEKSEENDFWRTPFKF